MTDRRFLAGCLALATAFWLPGAAGQAPAAVPRSPAPPPAMAPVPLPSTPPSLTPSVTPIPPPEAEYRAVSPDRSGRRDTTTYDFEADTVDGALEKPAAAAAAAPPDVPAYSDLCKASPKPPWCSDAPKGSGN